MSVGHVQHGLPRGPAKSTAGTADMVKRGHAFRVGNARNKLLISSILLRCNESKLGV